MVSLDLLCDYIDNARNDTKILYQVFFIPEAWYVVRESLKLRADGKYWERLESVREIPLCWLPRDGECLSLSNPQIASRLLINGDWTHLHKCAVALNQLVDMCRGRSPSGRPMTVYSKGKWANDVARMMKKVRTTTSEDHLKDPIEGLLKINRIVLIDRWLDPLTPMLSQLTFYGLVDEIYGIGMVNSVKVPEMEFKNERDGDPFAEKEIYLIDEVYHRLKHWHINAISLEASKVLAEIREDEQFDREKMSVAEYSVLVKKMPKIINRKKMIEVHMRLAEMIQAHVYCKLSDSIKMERELLDYCDSDKAIPLIEDQVYDAAPLNSVLRLISVHSLASGGLKASVLQHYRRIVNQSYGSSALNRILKMQKMGLIREKGGGGKMQCEYAPMLFQQNKKTYQMLPEVFSEAKLGDMASAYSGFTPLLCKILEEGDRVKWVGWPKTLLSAEEDPLEEKDPRGTCIFVIGGLTRSELALIRECLPNISLITTSALITGDKLLNNITNI
uniref:Vacuolar protein sorting-associated protein 33A n=1 Tax=Caenorhabditis tropicalis TaxID=1561998 RepID=A0A1I7UJ34_9PELO